MKIAAFGFFLMGAVFSAVALDVMVVPTRQSASMDWWYALPPDRAPHCAGIERARRGEPFRIIPFFTGFSVDSNVEARVTYDVQLLRPDGSVRVSAETLAGHAGIGDSSGVVPAEAILNFRFEREDAFGAYEARVIGVDHVARATNVVSTKIQLVPFEAPETTAIESERIFFDYPLAPDPAKAYAAFVQNPRSMFIGEEPVWSAVWFFKTVFAENDYLVNELISEFSSLSNKQQRDAILLLVLLERAEELPKLPANLRAFRNVMRAGRTPDPYGPLVGGKQIDMLWGEFFASGEVKPLRRIVDALSLAENAGSIEAIKNGELDPAQPEVKRAAALEGVFQAALISLRDNAGESRLARDYAAEILAHGELDESAANVLNLMLQSIE